MTTVHYSNLEDRYWIKDGEGRILWFDSSLEAQDYARKAEIDAAKLEERDRIIAYLARNRDDLERCLAAHDIEAGEHLK